MTVADFQKLSTPRQVVRHDITSGAVEDGSFDAGICCAQGFPISEGGVQGGDIAVANEDRPQRNLRTMWIERILGLNLGGQSGDVVTLYCSGISDSFKIRGIASTHSIALA